MGATERTTTVRIYASDHAWIQQRQREISAKESKWIDIPVLLHGLIVAVRRAEEGA
jgi:hypothetical protein